MKFERAMLFISSLVIPIVLFVVSPMWNSFFKDYKDVEYSLLSESKLVDVGVGLEGWPEIKILYKDEELKDAAFLIVKIKNTGTLPITKQDFQEPISMLFGRNDVVLGYRKVDSFPDDLVVSGTIHSGSLVFKPLLLNPGDGMVVEVLVKGGAKLDSITGRITGVASFKEAAEPLNEGLYLEYVSAVEKKGRSSHRKVLYISQVLCFFVAVVFLTTFLSSYIFKHDAGSAFLNKVSYLSRFLNYVCGLAASSLYAHSFSSPGGFLTVLNLLLPIVVSVFLVLIIKVVFNGAFKSGRV